MKKLKFIASLFLLPLMMSLSSCGAGYKPGDGSYAPSSFRPTSSSQTNPQTENIASGRLIFDYLLNPGSSFTYNNFTDPESFDVEGVTFTKADEEDLYKATIANKEVNVSSLYLADVNFDGNQDICIGTVTVTESKETYLSIAIYNVRNNIKLLELKDNGNFDYDFDLQNDQLIIEEMPYVAKGNRRSVSRVGRFVRNSAEANHLDWESNGYKLIGVSFAPTVICVEDQSVANRYKDSSGVDVLVLNTTNTFKITVALAYQGDYSTNTKQKDDCITFEVSEDFVTTFTSDQKNGTFNYNLSFKREGKYNFKASVEKFDAIMQIEVNNTLYDQLKVA